MLGLIHYLVVSAILFSLGLLGLMINRHHLIVLLMSIELMLLAVSTNFITFARVLHQPDGEVFVFFILAVAAAESAIGLALFIRWYRKRQSVDVHQINALKG